MNEEGQLWAGSFRPRVQRCTAPLQAQKESRPKAALISDARYCVDGARLLR